MPAAAQFGGAGVDGIAVVRHRRALSAIRASPLAFQAALLASSTWASASDTRAALLLKSGNYPAVW